MRVSWRFLTVPSAAVQRVNKLCSHVRWTAGACIIDRDALLRNLACVRRALPAGVTLRLVAKSLPCPQLLRTCMEQLGTRAIHVFQQVGVGEATPRHPMMCKDKRSV